MTTRTQLRTLVRGTYDLQKVRIQTGNRIAGNFRAKLGQEPGKKAIDTLSSEDIKMLDDLTKRHKRITDAIVEKKHKGPFVGDEVISDITEYELVKHYIDIEKVESEHFKRFKKPLEEFPIYTDYLKNVVGIGHTLSGVIISEIDIHLAKYSSSLHAYAGLDVGPDGKGRSRRKEHLVKVKYIDKHGNEAEKDSITFNPFLKTKLLGVLAPSFLRSGSPYAQVYRDYRHRIESNPNFIMQDTPGWNLEEIWTKARRDKASKRYMIKIFLIDLYTVWRKLEGLPVTLPYAEAKLGLVHTKKVA